MSTLALGGAESAGVAGSASRSPLRFADLALLAIALPVVVLAGLPLLGYGVAAGAWVAQRFAMAYAEGRTARSLAAGNRNDAFRTTAVSTLGRVWLVSFAVLLVGLLAGDEHGLSAAVLVAALFTVQFAAKALTHRGGEAHP